MSPGDLRGRLRCSGRPARAAPAPPAWSSLPRAGPAPAAGRAALRPFRRARSGPWRVVASVCAAIRSWSICSSTFSADLPAAPAQLREQRLGHLLIGFLRELADFAVVVLQRLRLFAFHAAVDHQHDHDQQHQRDDPAAHAAAHHQRVLVGPSPAAPAARPRRGRARRGGPRRRLGRPGRRAGAVSSPSSKNDKSNRSLQGLLEGHQYDCAPRSVSRACNFSVTADFPRAAAGTRLQGGERGTRWSRSDPRRARSRRREHSRPRLCPAARRAAGRRARPARARALPAARAPRRGRLRRGLARSRRAAAAARWPSSGIWLGPGGDRERATPRGAGDRAPLTSRDRRPVRGVRGRRARST